ncbi:MAG TPA: hypothetical protein ENF94_00460 [Candidatus Woesearchaeota archaeon]|nr:MAG: hypothetical protein DRJ25_01780 [Candidatus Woesearchaeota archaeon]HDD70611.1 hypothetical protein [Candidatus Woesearchaeota archaeon]
MVKCRCGKEALKGQKYCKRCFLRIFEKRVRKELQRYRWFKKGDKVLILDDSTSKTDILKEVFLPLVEAIRIPVKIGKRRRKGYRIVTPENADDECHAFLAAITKNKEWKKKEEIKPLRQITDEEIQLYIKIKGFNPYKRKKDELYEFIDDMEKKYPETKFALLKSSEQSLD